MIQWHLQNWTICLQELLVGNITKGPQIGHPHQQLSDEGSIALIHPTLIKKSLLIELSDLHLEAPAIGQCIRDGLSSQSSCLAWLRSIVCWACRTGVKMAWNARHTWTRVCSVFLLEIWGVVNLYVMKWPDWYNNRSWGSKQYRDAYLFFHHSPNLRRKGWNPWQRSPPGSLIIGYYCIDGFPETNSVAKLSFTNVWR